MRIVLDVLDNPNLALFEIAHSIVQIMHLQTCLPAAGARLPVVKSFGQSKCLPGQIIFHPSNIIPRTQTHCFFQSQNFSVKRFCFRKIRDGITNEREFFKSDAFHVFVIKGGRCCETERMSKVRHWLKASCLPLFVSASCCRSSPNKYRKIRHATWGYSHPREAFLQSNLWLQSRRAPSLHRAATSCEKSVGCKNP